MSITVRCDCGKKWKLPDESAGKTITCPACQARLAIPVPDPAAPKRAAGSGTASACPDCGGPLPAEAVLCIQCGFDRRTGRSAAQVTPATSKPKPSGRYPLTGLTLVYWGSRFGFGLITACLGLGLMLVGWFGGGPGVNIKDMTLMIVVGLIYAAIGMQVAAKGSRFDWSRADEDELEFEELLLARGRLPWRALWLQWSGSAAGLIFCLASCSRWLWLVRHSRWFSGWHYALSGHQTERRSCKRWPADWRISVASYC